jgi:hypothetical protein
MSFLEETITSRPVFFHPKTFLPARTYPRTPTSCSDAALLCRNCAHPLLTPLLPRTHSRDHPASPPDVCRVCNVPHCPPRPCWLLAPRGNLDPVVLLFPAAATAVPVIRSPVGLIHRRPASCVPAHPHPLPMF